MIDEGMSTLKTDTQVRQAALQNLLRSVDLSTKEADTAFLIELVGGIFGLFGLGYLYTGLTNTGLFRLVGYVVAAIVVGILFTICGTITFGLAFCLAPLLFIPQIALAYFSANDLKVSINAVKASGYSAAPSNMGRYIENPAPMPNDFSTTVRPTEVAVPPTPPAPSTSEVTLTPNTPNYTPSPGYTPSTPDIASTTSEVELTPSDEPTPTFPVPTPPEPATSSEPYTPSNAEGTDVDDNTDFNPDDLTKKV